MLYIIYFINHCLSASLLRPDGIKHNIHDTHAHINNTQHIDHKTQPPDDAPHASPRVASHAGPCATPFHTWGVARGPAGGCFTPWSPYHPKPLPYRAPAVPTLLIPPAPAAPHGDHWRGGTPPALSAAARWDVVNTSIYHQALTPARVRGPLHHQHMDAGSYYEPRSRETSTPWNALALGRGAVTSGTDCTSRRGRC